MKSCLVKSEEIYLRTGRFVSINFCTILLQDDGGKMCNKNARYLCMIVYQRERFFAVFCSIINKFQTSHITEKRCQFIVNVIFIVVITCKLHV